MLCAGGEMTSDVICGMDAHTADPAEMETLAKINSNAKHPPKDLHVCRWRVDLSSAGWLG